MQIKIKYDRSRCTIDRIADISFMFFLCVLFVHRSNNILFFISIALLSGIKLTKFILQLLRHKLRLRISLHTIWCGLFLILCIMSREWSLSKSYSNSIIRMVLINLSISILVMNHIRSKKDLLRVFKQVIIAALYLAIISAIYTPINNYRGGLFGSLLGLNNNYIALTLAISSIICLYLYNESKEKKFISIMVIFLVFILITGSRKALIIYIIGIIGFTYLKDNAIKNIKNIVIAIGIITILFYLLIKIKFLYDIVGHRLIILLQSLSGDINAVDSSIIERNYFIDTAKMLFQEKPIWGWGVNNFSAYLELIGYHNIAYSHNNHWELLSGVGMVGYITYYSIYYYILIISTKNLYKKDILNNLALIVMVIYIIFEYGFVSYFTPTHQLFIMLMFATIKINKKVKYKFKY